MSFFAQRRWALRETVRAIAADFKSFSLATFLAALAFSIPLFLGVLAHALYTPLTQLPTQMEMTVFAQHRANALRVEAAIQALPHVSEVLVIPREKALAELNDRLGVKTRKGARNPLPDVLVVKLEPSTTLATAQTLATDIEALKGVDTVAFDTAWQEKFKALSQVAKTTLLFVTVVMGLLILTALVAAVRLTTAPILTQMRTLHLFGSSASFAIRPWAWRGFVQMGLAMLMAWGAVTLACLEVNGPLAEVAALYDLTLKLSLPTSPWLALAVLGAGLTGWFVSALFALGYWQRVLR